jgi:hypothetical protein
MAEQLIVNLVFEKETPGTVRFKEIADEDHQDRAAIQTQYILKKDYVKLGSPKALRVTIEAGE